MRRVLIFSLNYYPFVGGAEVAIKEITNRVSDFEFHLIAYRFDSSLPRTEPIGNVIVHRVGWGKRGMTAEESFRPIVYLGKILYVPLAAWKALRLHQTNHFEGAWAVMSYMVFPLVLMRFCGIRIPYLLTLQEGDPFERVFYRKRIRIVKPLLSYGIRHATAVQTISTFLLMWARRAGFKGRGEVIPNGVTTAHFAQTFQNDDMRNMKESLGKKDGDVYLVTTSRLLPKNAVDDVIRALPLLPQDVSFFIYGVGPEEKKLRVLAKELGVSERVRFMGQIGHAEMPLILKACDIFIRPSRSEGMGNSFIEAFAAELPVIATQEGGIADFLFDEKRNPDKPTTGWAVDVNSPDQIVEAVKDILARPEKVTEVIRNAKKLALARYDWNLIAVDMQALFDDLSKTP